MTYTRSIFAFVKTTVGNVSNLRNEIEIIFSTFLDSKNRVEFYSMNDSFVSYIYLYSLNFNYARFSIFIEDSKKKKMIQRFPDLSFKSIDIRNKKNLIQSKKNITSRILSIVPSV